MKAIPKFRELKAGVTLDEHTERPHLWFEDGWWCCAMPSWRRRPAPNDRKVGEGATPWEAYSAWWRL